MEKERAGAAALRGNEGGCGGGVVLRSASDVGGLWLVEGRQQLADSRRAAALLVGGQTTWCAGGSAQSSVQQHEQRELAHETS